ncbi:metallophosphoesterase family protein [Flavobacterium akiainvivens]|nr:metallophosphoesterase [Flavobacterium akiainvivens]SFQ65615.1 3',5'-cyclic AMP phosphodiesterase CpdA [Flavobacterium akiainvivens]
METDYINQITIYHFSDLHFGKYHICNPDDPTAHNDGIPSLGELVSNDLQNEVKDSPVIIAVSGDFTQACQYKEFVQADDFLNKVLSSKTFEKLNKSDVFMVPGNHDVVFNSSHAEERFQPYCNFYNKFYKGFRENIGPNESLSLTQVHKLNKDGNKILFAEINCCMYVQNDTVDKSRGQVGIDAITKLKEVLENYSKESDFDDHIKIAMIHHHVVLLPSFIEPGRGVDSIMNANYLLEVLSDYGFHIILHGHKHYPQIFSYDPLPLWGKSKNNIPQLVVSGGSCGSSELPNGMARCNTYGIIKIKWHPKSQQARIKVETRGLENYGPNGKLLPSLWKWKEVNVTDKAIATHMNLPKPKFVETFDWDSDDRIEYYKQLRGSMPVVELIPSLVPGQAFEARAWIASHWEQKQDEQLVKVEWSAGPKFKKKQIANFDTNPNFCIAYQYYGPMVIEAKMTFADKYTATAFVYAHMPKKDI